MPQDVARRCGAPLDPAKSPSKNLLLLHGRELARAATPDPSTSCRAPGAKWAHLPKAAFSAERPKEDAGAAQFRSSPPRVSIRKTLKVNKLARMGAPGGARSWSGRRDSNPRHPAWKARALPTELLPLKSLPGNQMVVGEGFEPSKASAGRFTVCSLWPLGHPTDQFTFSGRCCRPAHARAGGSEHLPYGRGTTSWRRDSNPQPTHYK